MAPIRKSDAPDPLTKETLSLSGFAAVTASFVMVTFMERLTFGCWVIRVASTQPSELALELLARRPPCSQMVSVRSDSYPHFSQRYSQVGMG
jgi:hypothetical protein